MAKAAGFVVIELFLRLIEERLGFPLHARDLTPVWLKSNSVS